MSIKDFYIDECKANNEKDKEDEDYTETALVDIGCPVNLPGKLQSLIMPSMGEDGKSLSFNQFAFQSLNGKPEVITGSRICS